MELNETTKRIGFVVAEQVFYHFNVSMDSLYNKRGNNAEKSARIFVYLILHREFNISINQISLFTKKNARNILRRIAILKYRIDLFADDKNTYDDIVKKIKEQLSIEE